MCSAVVRGCFCIKSYAVIGYRNYNVTADFGCSYTHRASVFLLAKSVFYGVFNKRLYR